MPGFQINRVCLSGNLTADPEASQIPSSGTDVCHLRMAVNDRVKQGNDWVDRPNYFDVTIWRGLGAWAASNLKKGDAIVIEGKLRWRQWEDKNTGQKRSAVDVTADTLIPPRGERRQQQSETGFDTSGLPDVSSPPSQAPSSSRPPEEAGDDIPF